MTPLHILEAFLSGDFSSLWPPLAAVFTGAYKELNSIFNDIRDEFDPLKQLKDYAKSYYDDLVPSQIERIRKDIQELYDEVKQFGSDVVEDIGNAVNQGLGTGEVNPTAPDGSLGQARDIYTPDGQVPMDVGTLPGMDIQGGGMNRDAGGGGYGGSSSGGSAGGSGTTPLGGGSGSGSAGGSGTQPPTAGDLGVEPGSYIEYQPSAGQVVITHPDGTTETRPWPPT